MILYIYIFVCLFLSVILFCCQRFCCFFVSDSIDFLEFEWDDRFKFKGLAFLGVGLGFSRYQAKVIDQKHGLGFKGSLY